MKKRLIIAFVSLVSIAVLLMAGLSLYVSVTSASDALETSAKDKLRLQAVQSKQAIQDYLSFNEKQIRNFSSSSLIVEATKRFVPAYKKYALEREAYSPSQDNLLSSYYSNEFAQRYQERNVDALAQPTSLIQPLPLHAKQLQHDFIANSRFPIGQKDALVDLNNKTTYATVHSQYHEEIRRFLNEFGYYDIFIADVTTGNIVYSVYKELDFATSLIDGPYANTEIGKAFSLSKSATDNNLVAVSKIAKYLPSYDALAGFLSSPITDENGTVIGILIFQIPIDKIGSILTHNQNWSENGFGASGETFLVSPDKLLVTESRFFLENQTDYINALEVQQPSVAGRIKDAGTAVGIQPVKTSSVNLALEGKEGFTTLEDYRGVQVFSSYIPLNIGDYTYAILAEIDVDEALSPVFVLRSTLMLSTLVEALIILCIAIALALWLAKVLIKPLLLFGKACNELSSGNGDLTIRLTPSSIPEIDNIILPFNTFIEQVQKIVRSIKDNAQRLSHAAEELSSVMEQSNKSVTEQKQETLMVASSVEELSMTIADVSRSTVETRDASDNASDSLKENMERATLAADNIKLLVKLLGDSKDVISSLQNEVSLINSLLSDITSIADQTNLLALNAAIEAARAGEAGRGFSVVADEVRTLANRSQKSTVEISQIVERMNNASSLSVKEMDKASTAADGGIHLVNLVTTAMNELSQIIINVKNMTDSVASATEQQDATSDSVSENVNTIAAQSEEISHGVKIATESAQNLSIIAKETNTLVSSFKA
nr:methyl-accepting chemotaxis protein [Alteromonas sp. C1M14]